MARTLGNGDWCALVSLDDSTVISFPFRYTIPAHLMQPFECRYLGLDSERRHSDSEQGLAQ